MSVGFRHTHHDSGWVDPKEDDIAEDDLLGDVEIDHSYDVPFVAGMSKDGKTLFVDKDAYEEIKKLGWLRELIVHEMVEWLLMKMVGLKYKPAHNIALGAEEAARQAKGIAKTTYDHTYDKLIRMCASKRKPRVPPQLDTEPYQQDGTDEEKNEVEHGPGLMGGKIMGWKAQYHGY